MDNIHATVSIYILLSSWKCCFHRAVEKKISLCLSNNLVQLTLLQRPFGQIGGKQGMITTRRHILILMMFDIGYVAFWQNSVFYPFAFLFLPWDVFVESYGSVRFGSCRSIWKMRDERYKRKERNATQRLAHALNIPSTPCRFIW